MSEPAENYISQPMLAVMRRQAWKVWVVGLAIVSLWSSAIVVAPVTKLAGLSSISQPIYSFFHYICHQIPERSFHIADEQFGVCSRCSGVYFGIFLGFALYPLWRRIEEVEPLARVWLFLSMVPIAVDWSLTVLGIWENTQLTRVMTGLILGVACATYIVPAAVEITRNLTRRSGNVPDSLANDQH